MIQEQGDARRRFYRRQWLLAIVLFFAALSAAIWISRELLFRAPPLRAASVDFLVEPYLQLGPRGNPDAPVVVWASTDTDAASWKVLWRQQNMTNWQAALSINHNKANLDGLPAFSLFEAQLPPLPVHQPVEYKVEHGEQTVFQSTIRPVKSAGDSVRAVFVGDIAAGTPAQREVARQIARVKPDLLLVAGDIVYGFGRTSEYLDHFFPVYNSTSSEGEPLMRSTLFIAAPGNHDTAIGAGADTRNLDLFPDGLGYYLWWHQPLTGPSADVLSSYRPRPFGTPRRIQSFLACAGERYPLQDDFSFDYGSAHFVVLDGNDYMDWTNANLRSWLVHDLDAAKTPWKLVVFHQSPFASDNHHFDEQHMRVLCDIFENHGVNVVFSGHMHNYERSFPLKFHPIKAANGSLIADNDNVNGTLAIDRRFDGQSQTHPDGVIYIITGGGGAPLGGKKLSKHPEAWQPFTSKFLPEYSFSACDIDPTRLHIQQIAANGTVIDELTISK